MSADSTPPGSQPTPRSDATSPADGRTGAPDDHFVATGGPAPLMSARRVASSSGEVVVRVVGEIDLATIGDLTRVLDRAVAESNRGATLTLDMSGVRFLSASGIGRLVRAAGEAAERGLHLRVTGCSGAVVRTLFRTGTDHLLTGG